MYVINDRLAVGDISQVKPEMSYVEAVIGNIDDFKNNRC